MQIKNNSPKVGSKTVHTPHCSSFLLFEYYDTAIAIDSNLNVNHNGKELWENIVS